MTRQKIADHIKKQEGVIIIPHPFKPDSGYFNHYKEDDFLDTALDVLKQAEEKGVNIYLPVDSIVADNFSNDANTQVAIAGHIPDGWEGLDAGPKSCKKFHELIINCKTITGHL